MTGTDIEPYRKEMQAHCYRMLGSVQEAEDAVQETMLRAWRALDRFSARTSLRNWLYRIATNVCLTALARRSVPRRSVPHLKEPSSTRLPEGEPLGESLWLEPYPDALLEAIPDTGPGPQARYEMREATRLAFVAAIQHLPPRQRAVLLLRDVLGWSSAETAETLDASVASVNSALQRARESIRKSLPSDEAMLPKAISDEKQNLLLERYVHAWESADLESFISLLKQEAIFSMPPRPEWYRGRDAIRELLTWAWGETGYTAFRLTPSRANGQPAYALYGRRGKDALWRAHAIHVLTVDAAGIAVLTHFMNTELFPFFDMPLTLNASAVNQASGP